MSYDVLILAFLILVFCFFTMTLTINVMFSLLNSLKKDEIGEIKPIEIIKRPEKKPEKSEYEVYLERQKEIERERYNTIMDNLEAYDGTEIGQKEVR